MAYIQISLTNFSRENPEVHPKKSEELLFGCYHGGVVARKPYKQMFWRDGNIPYLSWVGYSGVHFCQNSLNSLLSITVFIIKEKNIIVILQWKNLANTSLVKLPMSSPVRRHIDTILWEEINTTPVYYFFKCIMMSKHQTNLNWRMFVK